MRKLKLQMNIALDNLWDDGMTQFSIDNLNDVDCILHGRKTAEGFIPYWTEVANNSKDSLHALGKRFAEIPNAVFSNTLKESKWKNTTIISGKLVEAINTLKNKNGENILVYGGDSFATSLLQNKLADEVYLQINPSSIGNGQQTFNPLKVDKELKLLESKLYKCGTVLLFYSRN